MRKLHEKLVFSESLFEGIDDLLSGSHANNTLPALHLLEERAELLSRVRQIVARVDDIIAFLFVDRQRIELDV